ncbi:MAG TPA: hypothetical protein PLG17_06585 [Thermodesulfobacteriota bacterium]|nr:hypothetical protein [Deltaproteobacteria bacterium]HNR14242.1 hypothetical protein [Thermodesulfobacteriota bacterium]HNU72591.1 hypothetical protein [Thermodesulfobacteriota bacterium]HOC38747.1 hypothetical protein [Thermodesulfobacteriota bacterium]HQO78162.1 hypothetical protein [Thermodesulfobacteriota bacterium]
MESGSIIIINLQNPREKILGKLIGISSPGITVRGIDVDSFREWLNQYQHPDKDNTIQPSTVFLPMHRVVSCYLDEKSGAAPSFSSQFHERSGKDLAQALA